MYTRTVNLAHVLEGDKLFVVGRVLDLPRLVHEVVVRQPSHRAATRTPHVARGTRLEYLTPLGHFIAHHLVRRLAVAPRTVGNHRGGVAGVHVLGSELEAPFRGTQEA